MKVVRHIITMFFLLLYAIVSDGQDRTIDSLKKILEKSKEDTNRVNTLNQLSESLGNSGNIENSRHYAEQALVISKRLKFHRGQALALQNIGYSYINQNNLSEARKFLLEGIALATQKNQVEPKARMLLMVGQTFGMEENYPEALEYFYQSLTEWEKIRNDFWTAWTLAGIGYVKYYQGDLHASVTTWVQARDIFKRLSNKDGLARSYIALGVSYQNLDSLELSLKNFSLAQKIYEEVDDKEGMFYVFQGHGDVTEKQAMLASQQESVLKYQLALKHYNDAFNLAEEINDSLQMAQANTHMGRINIKLKDLKNARKNLLSSLQFGRGNKENLKSVYYHMSTLDSLEGNYYAAYQNYQKYISYRDSLVNDEGAKKSLQAKMQYDFEKKELEATTIQEKKDAQAKMVRNVQYIAIGIFLLIAAFLYINNRQKQRSKRKIEKAYSALKATQAQLIQQEKMASLGELTAGIAHEIQNPLNFVNNFSDVNRELLEELKGEADKGNLDEIKAIANDVISNEQKINHHGKRADAIVKGMLQHSRANSGQKELTDINALADEYLRLAFHGLRAKDKSFNSATQTQFDSHVGKISVVPQDLGRVILNLINNAFYAVDEKRKQLGNGFDPTVTISTKKENGKVEIKIADNGNGIPNRVLDKIFQPFFTTKPTGQGTGLGLSLAYDIVTKGHNGELRVKTKEGEGSEFIIQIPG